MKRSTTHVGWHIQTYPTKVGMPCQQKIYMNYGMPITWGGKKRRESITNWYPGMIPQWWQADLSPVDFLMINHINKIQAYADTLTTITTTEWKLYSCTITSRFFNLTMSKQTWNIAHKLEILLLLKNEI